MIFKTNEYLKHAKSFNFHVMSMARRHYCHSRCSFVDDVIVAQCLRTVGVFAMNTLDEHFKGRFFSFKHTFMREMDVNPRYSWYWENRFEKVVTGTNATVEHMIGFHWYKDKSAHKSNRRKSFLTSMKPKLHFWFKKHSKEDAI
eukprot:491739_1